MPWDQLARTLGAQLDLRIVLPPDRVLPGTVPTGGYEEILTEQAQQWLAQAAATVSDGIEVTPHISFNESFAQGLIDDAQTLGAEVIVVGAAGDGLIGRHSIGSVTGELLYSAPVPLALAPRGALHSKVERVREVTCAIGTRRVRSSCSTPRVRASRAGDKPLRLVSLVALDPLLGALRGDDGFVHEHARAHAQSVLELAQSALPADFPVTSTVVDGPSVESAINKLDWHDGDVIMVGSSRLAQPRRLFLGSGIFFRDDDDGQGAGRGQGGNLRRYDPGDLVCGTRLHADRQHRPDRRRGRLENAGHLHRRVHPDVSHGLRISRTELRAPDCGASFTWSTKASGPYVGWMCGWGMVIASIIVLSNLAAIAVEFLYLFVARIFSNPDIADLADNKVINIVTTLAFLAVATWIASRGITTSEHVQYVLVGFQMVVLIAFALMAFVHVGRGEAPAGLSFDLDWFNPFSCLAIGAFVIGVTGSIFAFWAGTPA